MKCEEANRVCPKANTTMAKGDGTVVGYLGCYHIKIHELCLTTGNSVLSPYLWKSCQEELVMVCIDACEKDGVPHCCL